MVQLMKATPPMSSMMAGAMVAVTSESAECSQMPKQSTTKRPSRPDVYRPRQESLRSAWVDIEVG
jgi:hypothetical protein